MQSNRVMQRRRKKNYCTYDILTSVITPTPTYDLCCNKSATHATSEKFQATLVAARRFDTDVTHIPLTRRHR